MSAPIDQFNLQLAVEHPSMCFTQASQDHFTEFLEHHDSKKLFDPYKLQLYKTWLRLPNSAPPQLASQKEKQTFYAGKSDARLHYFLKDDIVYRKHFLSEREAHELNIPYEQQKIALQEVVLKERVFNIITDFHLRLQHAGHEKTHATINRHYYGITRNLVNELLQHCKTCNEHRSNLSKPPLQPIVSDCVLHGAQIDFVDKRNSADRGYIWIPHIKDHFSKFSSFYLLKSKTSQELTFNVAHWIGLMGVPLIQSALV